VASGCDLPAPVSISPGIGGHQPTYSEVKPYKKGGRQARKVPAGVGSTGFVKLSRQEFRRVVESGASWRIRNGYGKRI